MVGYTHRGYKAARADKIKIYNHKLNQWTVGTKHLLHVHDDSKILPNYQILPFWS